MERKRVASRSIKEKGSVRLMYSCRKGGPSLKRSVTRLFSLGLREASSGKSFHRDTVEFIPRKIGAYSRRSWKRRGKSFGRTESRAFPRDTSFFVQGSIRERMLKMVKNLYAMIYRRSASSSTPSSRQEVSI